MGSNQLYPFGARRGSAQHERWLEAASPDSIPLDERGTREWVDFARRFSSWIRFFDLSLEERGSWARFFESDITALYARLALESEPEFRREVQRRWKRIASPNADYSLLDRRRAMTELFAGLGSLAWSISHYGASLPRAAKLRRIIEEGVGERLSPALIRAMGFYKAARARNWILEPPATEWRILGQPLQSFSEWMESEDWDPLWHPSQPDMESLYQGVSADHRIFLGETDPLEQGRAAVQHHLFQEVFDLFRGGLAQLVQEAERQMEDSLESSADHLPHYTLFLSFIRMSRHQKALLNQLGQAHLDFYYKEVLRLQPKTAKPHRAHLVIGLAKHHRRHELRAGSLFFGGKDDQGRERWFQSGETEWITQASLGTVCSLYKGQSEDQSQGKSHEGRWFASPVANSADGLGKALPKDDPSWHPLVNKTYKEGVVESIPMPLARIGFAICSRHLFLAEGKRRIVIRAVLGPNPSALPLDSLWEIRVSTAKGWMDLPQPHLSLGQTSAENGSRTSFCFRIDIPASFPALEANPDLGYGDWPVLELSLSHGDGSRNYDYAAFEGVRLQGLELEVSCGWQSANYNQDGIKQLVLVNDVGNLDPTKPFLPFGARPGKGSSLIMGSPELFQKSGTRLRLFLEWDQLPSQTTQIAFGSSTPPKVDIDFLAEGKWIPGSPSYTSLSLFQSGSEKKTISAGSSILIPAESIHSDAAELDAFKPSQNRGFLRLRLKEGFGQDAFQSALRNFLIAMARGTASAEDEPQPPYLPTIRSLYISYLSRQWMDFESGESSEDAPLRFFHLHPFGNQRIHASVQRDETNGGLIPSLGEKREGIYIPHEAAFHMQVLDAEAGDSLSVLFQFQQGSSDPRIAKPKDHIRWSYLSGSQWKPFPRDLVVDQTQAGLRSGLIRFTLPLDAGGPQTLMPGDGIWIRAAVSEAPMAVCRIQGIHFQAIEVEESQSAEAGEFSSGPLAAGSISRLSAPEAAVKKVEQPYPGFGGRAPESDRSFQLRVSERLRHKDRAVTLWDYERLVLEAFPEVYRVHCLPNTRYEDSVYEESRPGHVTIIPLPDLRGRKDIHPLRPYTHQDTLEQIHKFLTARISPHVTLHVRQPRFEEVRLAMKLRFLPGLPFGIYKEKLQEEIGLFLTPWLGEGESSRLRLGGLVDKSVLIRFIDQRPYVDFVADLRLYHRQEEGSPVESADQDQVRASTARSILVSAPYGKHEIEEAEDLSWEEESGSCLPDTAR